MGKIAAAIRDTFGKPRFCSAVILAGGSGTRFSSQTPKQFTKIAGKTVLLRAAEAFEKCGEVSEIIVVTTADTVEKTRSLLRKNGINKLTRVVVGGNTRTKSAKNGFEAVNPACEFVAIHDAARCLITPDMITEAFQAAFVVGAAACASRCTDTIKKCDASDRIRSTIERDHVWTVQTPQVFRSEMYRAAVYYAEKDKVEATDDCALCERIHQKIQLVDVGKTNIKITYPEDVLLAEAILAMREKEKTE